MLRNPAIPTKLFLIPHPDQFFLPIPHLVRFCSSLLVSLCSVLVTHVGERTAPWTAVFLTIFLSILRVEVLRLSCDQNFAFRRKPGACRRFFPVSRIVGTRAPKSTCHEMYIRFWTSHIFLAWEQREIFCSCYVTPLVIQNIHDWSLTRGCDIFRRNNYEREKKS